MVNKAGRCTLVPTLDMYNEVTSNIQHLSATDALINTAPTYCKQLCLSSYYVTKDEGNGTSSQMKTQK